MLSRYKERQDGTNRWLINPASSAQYRVRLSLSPQHCMHQLHAMILPHSDHLQPNTYFMKQSYGRSILVMMPIANPVSLTDDADLILAYPAVSAQSWSYDMPRLPLRTLDDAPDASKSGLELSQKANGFLPNLVRLLANAPVALEAYQTLSGINARSGLRLAEREAIQITAAATHGCGFCVAGHTIVAYKRAHLSETVVNALRNNDHVPDERLNSIAEFTRAVIRSRGNVTDEELKAFQEAGFTDANTLEVVLGVSLATLCNFANNLGRSELNSEYVPYAWTNPIAAAAE